jgi:hypothetical protein
MFPKSGNSFPGRAGRLADSDYIATISDALRGQLGTGASASKQIQRWTDASDRTARNWLTGAVGPSGYHLVRLARESDNVFAAILAMTARPELVLSQDLHAVEVALAKASGALESLRRQRTVGSR